jgi:hypothetical protein
LLQQDHDIGETETDVLKQMGVVVDRVCTVCARYKQLTTSAAAAKCNTIPLSGDGVAERLEPVADAAANDIPQRTEPASEPQYNDAGRAEDSYTTTARGTTSRYKRRYTPMCLGSDIDSDGALDSENERMIAELKRDTKLGRIQFDREFESKQQ